MFSDTIMKKNTNADPGSNESVTTSFMASEIERNNESQNISKLITEHSTEGKDGVSKGLFGCGEKINMEERRQKLDRLDRISEGIPTCNEVQEFLYKKKEAASKSIIELQRLGCREIEVEDRKMDEPQNKILKSQSHIKSGFILQLISKLKKQGMGQYLENKEKASKDYDYEEEFRKEPVEEKRKSMGEEEKKEKNEMPVLKLNCAPLMPKDSSPLSKISKTPSPRHKQALQFAVEDLILEQKNRSVNEVYENLGQLGAGAFGVVYKVRHRETKEIRAMKKLPKDLYPANTDPATEYKIMKTLDHPNVLRLIEYWESNTHFFLVSEFMRGGSLLELSKAQKAIPEVKVVKIIEPVLRAMAYCHSRKIAHRDMKLENVMLDAPGGKGTVKIIDFGCSLLIKNKKNIKNWAGTAFYIPPEVQKHVYSEKADTWAIGIIMFTLLCGYFPFLGKTPQEFYTYIRKDLVQMNGRIWDGVSIQAKRLIRGLLDYSVERRLSAKHALNSAWINKNKLGEDMIPVANKALEALDNLCQFTQTSAIEQLILTFMSSQYRTKVEEERIQECFDFLDFSKNGFLKSTDLIKLFKKFKKLPEDLVANVVNEIFDKIDFNQNGCIEYSEFVHANLDWDIILTIKNLEMTFKRFDIGNKGWLTPDDFKEVFSETKNEDWDSSFSEGFGDKKKIYFAEFVMIMRSFLIEKSPEAPSMLQTGQSLTSRRISCFSAVVEKIPINHVY